MKNTIFYAVLYTLLIINIQNCGVNTENSGVRWTANGQGAGCFSDEIIGWDMNSTHAFFTRASINILNIDGRFNLINKFLLENIDTAVAYANAPDVNETNYCSFISHFYNPNNEKNYWDESTPTAKTAFLDHITKAKSLLTYYYKTNKLKAINQEQLNSILIEFSSAVHFLQDACMPFHAKNIVVGDPSFLSSDKNVIGHKEYEKWVEKNQVKWEISSNIFDYYRPVGLFEEDVLNLFNICANIGYNNFHDIQNYSKREQTTSYILENMQSITALLMERILTELNLYDLELAKILIVKTQKNFQNNKINYDQHIAKIVNQINSDLQNNNSNELLFQKLLAFNKVLDVEVNNLKRVRDNMLINLSL